MFALTFAHEAEARAFYKEQHGDFDAVEIAYLTLTAKLAAGSFPPSWGLSMPLAVSNCCSLVRRNTQKWAEWNRPWNRSKSWLN